MELIAKIYPHLWSEDLIEQIPITSEVVINNDLKWFGTAQLTLPIHPQLKENAKIELYEANSNQDRLVFAGFVYEIRPVRWQFKVVDLVLRDYKAIFHQRKALQNYKFTNQPIASIVEQLLTPYNTQYNERWEGVGAYHESISLEINGGDDYYDIFDEICDQKELFWCVKDGLVSFQKYGRDLRDHQLLEYDWSSANPWNITKIELIGTASGGNVVLLEDSNGMRTMDTSQYRGILTWVVSKQIRAGDNIAKAKQFAQEQSRPQRLYQIQVANGSIQGEIGDRIKVEVINTNSYYDYTGDALIQTKTITYTNASKIVEYGIQEFMASNNSPDNRVQQVEKTIKLLQQKRSSQTSGASQPVDLSGLVSSSDFGKALATKADANHTHRRDEIQGKPTAFTPTSHHHDSEYYRKSDIDAKISQKANDDAVVHRTGDETIAWKKTFADLMKILTKTNAVSDMSLTIGTRHMISAIEHGDGGHITQILRWDCQPEGNKFDGGRWLEFGSHGDPYLSMNTHTTTIGRSAGNNGILKLRGSQILVNDYDMLSIFDVWKDYIPERRAGSQAVSTITNRYAKYKVIGKTCFVSWEATIKNLAWSIKEISANLPLPCTIKQGGSGVYHDGLFRTLVAQIEGERMYFFRDGEASFSSNGLIRYSFVYEIA